MRYLISYHPAQPSGERLENELARRRASRLHRSAWMLEADVSAADLLVQLAMFVDDADSLVVGDVTGHEVALATGPEHTLSIDDVTPTQQSLAGASLFAEGPDAEDLEFPLAAEPGEPTS